MTAAQQPGLDRAAEQYRMAAAGYDHRTRWLSRYRRRAVDQLRLAPGAVVIEAACGTGINFPLLQQRAGLFPQPGSSPSIHIDSRPAIRADQATAAGWFTGCSEWTRRR